MSNLITYTVSYWIMRGGQWVWEWWQVEAYTTFEAERLMVEKLNKGGSVFHLIGCEELEIEKK